MTGTEPRDPDTELMVLTRGGDEHSFNQLIHRNRLKVVHRLIRLVGNASVAEDLAQDVFIRVYRSRGRYEPRARFSTWLYRITANVARNYFRDEWKERQTASLDERGCLAVCRQAPDISPGPEHRMLNEAAAQEIRAAVRSLPPRQRAVVVMHRFEERDYPEIAKRLGCSTPAVKSLMYRANEALRNQFGACTGDPA